MRVEICLDIGIFDIEESPVVDSTSLYRPVARGEASVASVVEQIVNDVGGRTLHKNVP
jgi:hypothetical protein